MKEFSAAAMIRFYNSAINKSETENIVLSEVANFTDAVTRIEEYYKEDLESIMEVTLFEGPFIVLNNNSYLKFVEGELE